MPLSNCTSRPFLTRFKSLLVLTGLIFVLADLGFEVKCGGKLKGDKSTDLNVALDSKSPEPLDGDEDDEYYYEQDEDIKITKTIPAVRPTSPILPLETRAIDPSVRNPQGRKWIDNRIDNDQDLLVRIRLNNSPGRVMNYSTRPVVSPPISKNLGSENNMLDKENGVGVVGEISQSPSTKEMKSIADEVSDAILAEADRIYAFLSPEESKRGSSKLFSPLNKINDEIPSLPPYDPHPMGFTLVDDSSYAICTSAE